MTLTFKDPGHPNAKRAFYPSSPPQRREKADGILETLVNNPGYNKVLPSSQQPYFSAEQEDKNESPGGQAVCRDPA